LPPPSPGSSEQDAAQKMASKTLGTTSSLVILFIANTSVGAFPLRSELRSQANVDHGFCKTITRACLSPVTRVTAGEGRRSSGRIFLPAKGGTVKRPTR
jgi:hypothetical protein